MYNLSYDFFINRKQKEKNVIGNDGINLVAA